MARPPADVGRFKEAVHWFRQKVLMTDDEYQELEDWARQRAFTVAGLAQLDAVAQVWEALDQALDQGTTLEDFRKEVGPELAKAWGRNDGFRVETIFRTNLQVAYAAGRQEQMKDPDVLEARPYWEFMAILDSRTSEICRPLDHTLLPADDGFWSQNTPPLHHRCRSTLVSRTKEQGEKAGVREPPANSRPASPGFGGDPTADYEPDLDAKPEALVKVFRNKTE